MPMESRVDPTTDGGLAFGYRASVAPMLWVFIGLAGIELMVVHALLSHWFPMVALALSALTLVSIAWLIWVILSFGRLPVLIESDTLVMRVGRMKGYRIPLADIEGLRERWTAKELNKRGVANLALLAWPNVWIDLRRPRGCRRVVAIAHKLDDAAAFRAALQPLLIEERDVDARLTCGLPASKAARQ